MRHPPMSTAHHITMQCTRGPSIHRHRTGSHVVVGVDVAVYGARRSIAKRQQENVDVEHPIEVGENLGSML